ncbi:MAG: AAA family ATPase, partial [Elainellaceae cyanobacterium]
IDLRDSPSEGLRHRGQLLDAVVQGLAAASSPERPLLLVLDDIQWLDDASATLLHYVFRLLGDKSLRIACAAREQELQENPAASTLLESLRRANRLQEVTVPPLSPEAVFTLVRSLQPNAPENSLNPQRIYSDSGGNPLFALEAARAVTQDTSNLSALIGDRLQRLDPAARDLLPWAAALGRQFNSETLALAADYSPMQFLTAIAQLEGQQIVCPTQAPHDFGQDDGQVDYDFVQDLVRQVAYAQLSQPQRRLIHGQLAKTLNTQMVDNALASQVAYHAGIAGNHALAAQAYAAAAARSLRLFAYSDVIQLVEQGLGHCQPLPPRDRLLLSAQLLRSRVIAGVAPADAATLEFQIHRLLGDMVGLSIPEAEVTAQEALSYLNYEQGNLAAVHDQVIKALETLPLSPRLQAESLATNGSCLAEIERDMDRAEAILLEAQAIADRLGLTLIDVAVGLGSVSRYRGDYDQARHHLQQALHLAQNQQDFVRQSYALTYLVMVGWDDHAPDITEAQALLTLAAQRPQGSEGAFAQGLIALESYAENPSGPDALDRALRHLDQLDAQRRLGFVASHASEIALAHSRREASQGYAAITHQAAQRVGHPNDMAIAAALQVLSADSATEKQRYWRSLQDTIGDDFRLSARARLLCSGADRAMQQLVSTHDSAE